MSTDTDAQLRRQAQPAPLSGSFDGLMPGSGRAPTPLMVFDGSSDPSDPKLLGRRPDDLPGQYIGGGCLEFDGRTVTMYADDYNMEDPAAGKVRVQATWTGDELDFDESAEPGRPAPADCRHPVEPA